jgi:hypothetical protein
MVKTLGIDLASETFGLMALADFNNGGFDT